MPTKIKICAEADLTEKKSIKFAVPEKPTPREAFAVRYEDRVYAYFNECAHISLPLDWDDNDFFSLGHTTLMCKNHGAEYAPDSGLCVVGPCVGARLKDINVVSEDGVLFAIID